MLERLEKEKYLLEFRQKIPDNFDLFGNENRKDLIEHWDDEKIKDWRGKIIYKSY